MLLFFSIKPIAHIFSEDTSVVAYTANYFYIVSASYIFYGLFVITSSIFNGLQLPLNSMKLMLLKSVLFTIPFTLIGSYFGVEGIYIGISLGNIAAGFLASYEMRKQFKKENSKLAKVNIWKEYKNDFSDLFK